MAGVEYLVSRIEKPEDDLTMLAIIDEYGKIDRESLDNLTYALKSLGVVKDNHFVTTYSGLYSYMLHGSIERMVKDGLIEETVEDMGEEHSHTRLPCYTLTWKGEIVADSDSPEKRVIIKDIKENAASPFRFAIYCRLLDDRGKSEAFGEAKRYGLDEDEIRVYEELWLKYFDKSEPVSTELTWKEKNPADYIYRPSADILWLRQNVAESEGKKVQNQSGPKEHKGKRRFG